MSDFISRQDAINAVENTSIPFCTFGKKSREYNALKRDAVYAIKALPSADREDYEKGYKDGQLAVMTGNDEKEFERGYRMGQAADRPRGEWEETGEWVETDSDEPCWYRCSECARRTDEASDYCPNCGAKMK